MSYFEFREWVESMVPWWVPLVASLSPFVVYFLAVGASNMRRRFARWKRRVG